MCGREDGERCSKLPAVWGEREEVKWANDEPGTGGVPVESCCSPHSLTASAEELLLGWQLDKRLSLKA